MPPKAASPKAAAAIKPKVKKARKRRPKGTGNFREAIGREARFLGESITGQARQAISDILMDLYEKIVFLLPRNRTALARDASTATKLVLRLGSDNFIKLDAKAKSQVNKYRGGNGRDQVFGSGRLNSYLHQDLKRVSRDVAVYLSHVFESLTLDLLKAAAKLRRKGQLRITTRNLNVAIREDAEFDPLVRGHLAGGGETTVLHDELLLTKKKAKSKAKTKTKAKKSGSKKSKKSGSKKSKNGKKPSTKKGKSKK